MAQDDTDLRQYQDDLDTSDDALDPIMSEENDDPMESLRVPPDELREELERIDEVDEDDMPERGEDSDLKERW